MVHCRPPRHALPARLPRQRVLVLPRNVRAQWSRHKVIGVWQCAHLRSVVNDRANERGNGRLELWTLLIKTINVIQLLYVPIECWDRAQTCAVERASA